MKVLNFGSLNLDYVYSVDHIVLPGETLSTLGRVVNAGGKGLNQSIALAHAGAVVFHAGSVGIEEGTFLIDTLASHGVDTTFIKRENGVSTGHAIVQVNDVGENCILIYPGANHSINRCYVDEVLSHFSKGDFLVLQNEINELEYIIAEGKRRGMMIVLNPSPYTESFEKMPLDHVDYFVLNEIECARISGCKAPEEGVVKLIKKFPNSKVILTLGSKGVIYKDRSMDYYQEAYPVNQIIDTTAAGDTFMGFFMGSLLKGKSISECLKIGCKAAALGITRKGAAESIPMLDEVMKECPTDEPFS
jgi:ribokinase